MNDHDNSAATELNPASSLSGTGWPDRDFLLDLLDTPAPSGFETPVQRKWAAFLRPLADSVESDAYGNTWATLRGTGSGPVVMLEAHADEIGFMIRHISESGLLSVNPIGGSDRAITPARRVSILGDNGPVPGIFGNTAVHLRGKDAKTPEWQELYVDVGASSLAEVESLGLRVGHPLVLEGAPQELGPERLSARSLDNRIGGYILAQVASELARSQPRPHATLLAVNAVHEEIGGWGARMISHRLRPDLAIILDVTHATDTPGISHTQHGHIRLGKGPTLTHGTVNHPALIARLMDIARREAIPLQHESSSRTTGTDTEDICTSRDGIPSVLLSIPLRYMHSPIETADRRDVRLAILLLAAFLRSLAPGESFHTSI